MSIPKLASRASNSMFTSTQSVPSAFRRTPPMGRNSCLKVSEEVREALKRKAPVVALETTIYTHGFPYPDNVALASDLESIVRRNGGIPATIGVLEGVAHIGFSAEELKRLTSSAGGPETKKVSRRDLAYILGQGGYDQKMNGGTTISGTIALARIVNIRFLATGGLGGVHKGVEKTMDISADLTELARSRIAVVSSGCKSFLDIPRTLEYLETQGVGVGTFSDGRDGQVDFPAFWSRDSSFASPKSIMDEEEAAHIMYAQGALGLESGLLFANPVPAQHSIPKEEMDTIITTALADAERSGSTGSDNTPFVLKRIREITNGRSIIANRALIEANVARGTKVAVHFARLVKERNGRTSQQSPEGEFLARQGSLSGSLSTICSNKSNESKKDTVDVLVAGSLAIDSSCNFMSQNDVPDSRQLRYHTSNPASISQSLGGVGHNVATALHYSGTSVRLCSSIGQDIAGSTSLEILSQRGLQTSGIQILDGDRHTAQYIAVNDEQKDLVLAMADMKILEDPDVNFDTIWNPHIKKSEAGWLVLDANWDPLTLRKWLNAAKSAKMKVAYEPVSSIKSPRIFSTSAESVSKLAAFPNHVIDLATPNALELEAMHQAAEIAKAFEHEDWQAVMDNLGLSSPDLHDRLVSLTRKLSIDTGIVQSSIRLLPFIPCILTTLGQHGVLMTRILRPEEITSSYPDPAAYIFTSSTDANDNVNGVYVRLFPPAERVSEGEITSVNGVGDTFLGVLIAGLAKDKPKDLSNLVDIAQRGAVMTLKSKESVSPEISVLRASL